MLARQFNRDKDLARVDVLLGGEWGDFDATTDRAIVVESAGEIVGVLFLRSMPFVHEFAVKPSLGSRAVASALLNYAAAMVTAHGHKEAAFIVATENKDMRRFVVEAGAVRQDPGELYTLELK